MIAGLLNGLPVFGVMGACLAFGVLIHLGLRERPTGRRTRL